VTHAERKSLREKHRSHLYQRLGIDVCFFCSDIDFVGRVTSYPCDVIKVLDAWNEETQSDRA
jgi:hypothetical protein